jgi:DHA1 family tetracycline resistance protein-like MFS transporter
VSEFGPGKGERAAVGFVFAVAVLDMLGLGIIAPIMPTLIKQLVNGDAAVAARYMGWFGALWAVMQFVFQPVLGGLSDRFGRRPVLLLSMFGTAADYLVMAWAPSIGWLILGRAISGFSSATYSTASAYIADITPPAERAARFGLMSAAFGIGFIGGPAIGGLLGQLGPRLPFWGAAALCLAAGLYGLFVVPESLKPEHRAQFSLKIANPLGAVDLFLSRPGLAVLAGVMFLYSLAHQVLQNVWVLYANVRYHWTPGWMGASLAVVGVGSILVSTLLVRPTVARLGERRTLYAGLLFGALGFVLFGLAPAGWLFLAAIPVFSLMGLVGPGAQGLMSRVVSPSEQGRLQGANASLNALASIGGPVLFTYVFAQSIRAWSPFAPMGLAFFLAAALMVLALALALGVRAPAAASAAAPQPST